MGIFQFKIPKYRIANSSARIFALWITLPAFLLIAIALIFLKNQTRPIINLARASEKFGRGECLYGMHADPDENGHVSHYDIMFNHGIEKNMDIKECEVIHERMHGHKMKKKEDK